MTFRLSSIIASAFASLFPVPKVKESLLTSFSLSLSLLPDFRLRAILSEVGPSERRGGREGVQRRRRLSWISCLNCLLRGQVAAAVQLHAILPPPARSAAAAAAATAATAAATALGCAVFQGADALLLGPPGASPCAKRHLAGRLPAQQRRPRRRRVGAVLVRRGVPARPRLRRGQRGPGRLQDVRHTGQGT